MRKALAAILWFLSVCGAVSANEATVPAGTRLFLTTDQAVSSKRGESEVGQIVPCRVWRDVMAGGALAIKGDTPATCRIDKIRRRNIGGFEGRVSLAGVSTTAIDGQQISLQGGYNKEGSGRKAVAWTVGLLLLWPALLVPGGAADLPPGTVFDVSIVNTLTLQAGSTRREAPRINLSSLNRSFEAEVLLEEFLAQETPDVLKIRVSAAGSLPASFLIDNVNGQAIDPLSLEPAEDRAAEAASSVVLQTKVKPLAKHFRKGINRFEVATTGAEGREAVEVILDVQM
jgi:hypothetical protein